MIGIIPAAGKGTRLKELGKHYSKTTLPYKEKPLIIHQIEWLEKQGCDEIRIVLNHQRESVERILEMYGKNPTIYIQEKLNGLSGAILAALPEYTLKNAYEQNLLICLGDVLPTENIKEYLYNFVSVQSVDDYSRWCMVKPSAQDAPTTFYDKPRTRPETMLAVSGVYYLKNADTVREILLNQMEHDFNEDEYQFSYVLQTLALSYYIATPRMRLINFGTLVEYLENKGVKSSRSFNDIRVNKSTVEKASNQHAQKIRAEVNWFNDIPPEIKVFTPKILDHYYYDGSGKYRYTMEKILAPSLRELYLFLETTKETWETIFDNLFDNVLSEMEQFSIENDFMQTVIDKTIRRASNLGNHIDLTKDDLTIVDTFLTVKLQRLNRIHEVNGCLMHGDFCFSNILYDLNYNKVTMIDPRGELQGNHYYDVAKLYHSVMCDYDFVDSELYVVSSEGFEYTLYNKGKEHIKVAFMDKLEEYYTEEMIEHIRLITASLFLSMIPLHAHNKNNQKIYFDIFKKLEANL